MAKIQITIIDDIQSEKCDSNCGVDWSSTEVIALASKLIKDRFGDEVRLGYLDLSHPTANHHALEFKQRGGDKKLSLPLLVIDGQLRISGQFDIRMLLDAVDAEQEIKP